MNTETFSKILGFDQDFQKYLGGVTRNATGHIVEAKATFIRFFGKVNVSAITKTDTSSTSKGSPVDQFSLRWETSLIQTLTSLSNASSDYQLFPNVAKSFGDLSAEAIEGDAFIFGCGTAIMYVLYTLYTKPVYLYPSQQVRLRPAHARQVQLCGAATRSVLYW